MFTSRCEKYLNLSLYINILIDFLDELNPAGKPQNEDKSTVNIPLPSHHRAVACNYARQAWKKKQLGACHVSISRNAS